MTSRSAVTFCNFQQNQYFWSVILKVSQKGFGNSRILVHCRFSSYFTLITKKKLHFSLTCSFYYCLMRRRWALKVAWQFAIRGLFAYKRVAYKKLNLRHLSSVFHVHCLKRFWSSKVLSLCYFKATATFVPWNLIYCPLISNLFEPKKRITIM